MFNDFHPCQMSGHLPLWVEMEIDLADSFLNFVKKVKGVTVISFAVL